MSLQLDFNLQKITILRIAIAIWEHEYVIKKIRHYFYVNGKNKSGDDWRELIKEVINLVDPKVLPSVLYFKLIYLIRDIGVKLRDFFHYLKNTRLFGKIPRKQVYDFYFKKIYWTPFGTIDVIRIFKESWLHTPEIKIHVLYNMACTFCLEDYIEDLWKKIPAKVKAVKYNEKIYENFTLNILVYWDWCRKNKPANLVEELMRLNSNYDDLLENDQTPEEIFFLISVRKGYKYAVKYFYYKMTKQERRDNIMYACVVTINNYSLKTPTEYYRKDEYVEVFLFLIQKAAEIKSKEINKIITTHFLQESDSNRFDRIAFFEMFTQAWPWQQFLVDIFESIKMDVGRESYLCLLNTLLEEMSRVLKLSLPVDNCEYQRKFRETWLRSPAKLKKFVNEKIVTILFNLEDISNVKLIINDVDLSEEKENIMKFYRKHFAHLIEINKCEEAVHFIQELVPETYPRINQENIKDLYQLIFQGDFNLVNRKFNSLSNREEEKNLVKNYLDHKAIVYYFIVTGNLDLADTFLLWRYDGLIQKLIQFKDDFKCDPFVLDHIYGIWKKPKEDVETARNRSNNFLNWFLNSEEEILSFKMDTFLKSLEQDKEIKKKLIPIFVEQNCFEITEYFLEWCLFSKNEISEIKKKIVNHCAVGKCVEYLKANDFDMANKFLKWAYSSQNDRIDFLFLFWEDHQGMKACQSCVHKICNTLTQPIVVGNLIKFVSLWIKPMRNEKRKEVVNKLKKWAKSFQEPEEDETSSEEEHQFSTNDDNDSEYCDVRDEILFPRQYYRIFKSLLQSLNDPYFDDWHNFE